MCDKLNVLFLASPLILIIDIQSINFFRFALKTKADKKNEED